MFPNKTPPQAAADPDDFSEIVYVVDAEDRVVSVSSEWEEFGTRNGGSDLRPEQITGRPVWEFIADEETRKLYRRVLAHVRAGMPADMVLRCDGPARRRLVEMIVSRRPNGQVEFRTILLSAKSRPAQRLFDHQVPRTEHRLPVCSWCDRVKTDQEEWLEVEEVMDAMQLTTAPALPGLAPAVCPVCAATVDFVLKTSV
jgi:hypothetical protein